MPMSFWPKLRRASRKNPWRFQLVVHSRPISGFRSFGSIAAGFGGESERLDEETCQSQRQFTRLPDLTYTLGARRNHHPHRLTLVHPIGRDSPRNSTVCEKRRVLENSHGFHPPPEKQARASVLS